jgi:hypothetical protein
MFLALVLLTAVTVKIVWQQAHMAGMLVGLGLGSDMNPNRSA